MCFGMTNCNTSPVIVTERVITQTPDSVSKTITTITSRPTLTATHQPTIANTPSQILTHTKTPLPNPTDIPWNALTSSTGIIGNLKTATRYRLPYWAEITGGELYLNNRANSYSNIPVIELSDIQGDFGVRYTIVFETSNPQISVMFRDQMPVSGTWWKNSRRIDVWLQNNQLSAEYRHGESEQNIGQYYHQKYFPFVINQPYDVAVHFTDGNMQISIGETQLGTISTKNVLEKGTLIISFNLSPQDAITITNLILEMPSEESGNITIEFP